MVHPIAKSVRCLIRAGLARIDPLEHLRVGQGPRNLKALAVKVSQFAQRNHLQVLLDDLDDDIELQCPGKLGYERGNPPPVDLVLFVAKMTYFPSQSLDTLHYTAFNGVGVVASVSYEED